MHERKVNRIVTFMAHEPICQSAKVFLTRGSHVMTLSPPERVFVVRKVVYDDETPIYSIPGLMEQRYYSSQELKEKNPKLSDSPILDNDHSLKIYSQD